LSFSTPYHLSGVYEAVDVRSDRAWQQVAATAARAVINSQAEKIRELVDERMDRLRTDREHSSRLNEEFRERQAQEAKERERRNSQEEEEEKRKKQEQEMRDREKRDTEARTRREAAAKADKAREKKRWEGYKASWERFSSLTLAEVRSQSVQEIVPWPTDSGEFPDSWDEEEIRLFFVTGASHHTGPARNVFVEERNRWHPDSMNRQIMRKEKEVDEKTGRAITAISQILNELCVA
jgi:phage-related minor tail protein